MYGISETTINAGYSNYLDSMINDAICTREIKWLSYETQS
jgi:hypothetical protein